MSERIGTDAAEVLPGSFGADLILGLGGNDRIDGNAGSDTLAGNAGIDTIFGGLDNDFVIGGKDDDLLYGDEGNDTIFGNKGIDAIEGGSGDDVIFGGQGNDVILGGNGNDVIRGDLGADSLVGGSGADVFVLTRTSGGATIEEADTIVDFVPGIDSIGLADSIEAKSLNITFQAIANSSSRVNVILQDLSSGQILAVVENVSRSEFTSNDVFTTILDTSSTVDVSEIPASETGTIDDGTGGSTVNTVTRDSVGKSAPLTANTTIIAFEDTAYAFSSSDFSFFDIDGDPFSAVRITSLPGQGDLFTTSTTTDPTTGNSTATNQPVTVGAEIASTSLSSLIFVPDPSTTGADYASFTFRVSDGANLSNVGTAAVIVKDKAALTVGETNVAAPTIDAAEITTQAKEPENGANTTVQLFDDIDLFDDSGNLTSATVSLSGGSPATGEDVLSVTGLPAGITASAYDAANRILTLTGAASVDDYETALKLIQYTNTVNSVSKTNRTVTVAIEDGLNAAVSKSYSLAVAADDDAVEIKNADTSALTVTESALDSATNPISQSIFADSGGTLTFLDPDTAGGGSAAISSIQVSISSGFQSGADSFGFGNATSLPATFDGVNGVLSGNTLTLTANPGSSPNASDFATALKTVRFTNNSDTPDTSMRGISIAINGATPSLVRSINVTPTNDPPEISNASLTGSDFTIGTTTNLDFSVADLVGSTKANATDRDTATASLGLGVTAIDIAGSGGTWEYSSDGVNFSAIGTVSASSPLSIGNSGKIRFRGAGTAGSPSLSFKAWDGSDFSSGTAGSGTATLSLNVKTAGTTFESGPGIDSYDAGAGGKTTIVYDALNDAKDTITNFNPTEDVLTFKGSAFNVSNLLANGKKTLTAGTSTTFAKSDNIDIIFFGGSNGQYSTLLSDNAGNFQDSTIILITSSGRLQHYNSVSNKTTSMAEITLAGGFTFDDFSASTFDFIS
jgi:hypothetical protein